MFGVVVQLRSSNELCGNSEKTKQCHYKMCGLTEDVAGTLQRGSGAVHSVHYGIWKMPVF